MLDRLQPHSKPTRYRSTHAMRLAGEGLIRTFREADGLEDGLRRVARMYAGLVIQPEVLQLRRWFSPRHGGSPS